MGSGGFSGSAYDDATRTRRSTGKADFEYDKDIKTGAKPAIAASTLDPAKAIAGAKSDLVGSLVRESRDIDGKLSLPIMLLFDVTGSMNIIPQTFQARLPKVIEVVRDKAKVEHPQVLIGAIGDAEPGVDKVPFQISQFEADNRMDEHLRQVYLEGGGGGQDMESYGLAYYFAARHTATDSWDKRGKKGYLITMGDEAFWPIIRRDQVKRIFGVDLEKDIPMSDVLAETQERWEVFHLHCLQGNVGRSTSVQKRWKDVLGERLILVEDANLVSEIIAGIVATCESAKGIGAVVDDLGLTGADATKVTHALAQVSSTLPAHVADGGLPNVDKKTGGGTTRI